MFLKILSAFSVALTTSIVGVSFAKEPGRACFASDFEKEGIKDWKVSNYQDILTIGVTNDGEVVSLVIENRKDGKRMDTCYSLETPRFAVTPGADFAVIVEARGTVSMLATFRTSNMSTAIKWYGADGKPLLIQDPLGKMVPSGFEFGYESDSRDWTKSVRRSSVPEGASFAQLILGADSPDIQAGRRLEIRRVAVRLRDSGESWDFGDLNPPKFERLTESPSPDQNAVIRFRVSDESTLDMDRFFCTFDGRDAKELLVDEGEGVWSLKGVGPWQKDSLHLLTLDVCDICGNRNRETLAFFCGERQTRNIVTLRDDGMTLIDGKPFFPIAPFSFRKCPANRFDVMRGLRELQENGCNAVGSYMTYYSKIYSREEYEELMSACDACGMRLFVEVADRDYHAEDRPERLRQAVVAARKHPSVLCWGVGDDTGTYRRAIEVKNDHNIIKAIDSSRLTSQADISSFAGRYLPFVGSTDVFMNEIYPFRAEEPEPHGLAQIVRDMKHATGDRARAGSPVKSIWPLPQAFSGWKHWKRFPTREEIRAQSYLAIIHGGKGLTYYTYYSFSKGANGFAHKPEQKEAFFSVTRELASIQDDLASRDMTVQPNVEIIFGPAKDLMGNPSVSCLLKEGAPGRGRLLIAANAVSTEPVKVRFSGVAGSPVTLFEKGRELDVSNGFVETFGPGEVHVYRLDGWTEELSNAHRVALNRQRAFLYNTDGCDMLHYPTNGPINAEAFIGQRLGYVRGTDISSISYCPTSSGFGYFTVPAVGDPVAAAAVVPGAGRYNAMMDFAAIGRDCFDMSLEFCRREGYESFLSIRMNDSHDGDSRPAEGKFHPLFSKFRREHPECLMGDPAKGEWPKQCAWQWTCVDYSHAVVRDFARRFVRDFCERYDMDGIEFDFCRHPKFFRRCSYDCVATDAERKILTDFVCDLRRIIRSYEIRRGHPILVNVRVPDSVAYCRDIGIDLPAWLAAGALDGVIGGCYFNLEDWAVMADVAHGAGVKFYASVDESRIPGACKRWNRRMIPGRGTFENYCASYAQAMSAGSDGVYLFNLEYEKLRACTRIDPRATYDQDKIYFATQRGKGGYEPSHYLKNGYDYMKLPYIDPAADPKILCTDRTGLHDPGLDTAFQFEVKSQRDIMIRMGEDFTKARYAGKNPTVTVLALATELTSPAAEFTMNGHRLENVRFEAGLFTFADVPPGWVRFGLNTFTVRPKKESFVLNDFAVRVGFENAP